MICFPVLSLANEDRVLETAKKQFKYVRKIGYKEWVLPNEMMSKVLILERLKKKGYINFKKKFGLVIWTTKVYIAHN